MRPEFRTLRVRQLERALEPFDAAKNSPRPQKGWLRAVREATGISLRDAANQLAAAGHYAPSGKVCSASSIMAMVR